MAVPRLTKKQLHDMQFQSHIELDPVPGERREAVRVVIAGQEVGGDSDNVSLVLGSGAEGLSTIIDTSNDPVTYIGDAPPGTATSAVGWRILRIDTTTSSNQTFQYADGDALFDNVWDDRATTVVYS